MQRNPGAIASTRAGPAAGHHGTLRRRRRLGRDEPLLQIVRAREDLARFEPDRDFAFGRVGRIAAVHEIAADRLTVVAADRAGRGFDRIGRADRRAAAFDRIRPFDHDRDDRRAREVLDEAAERTACLRVRRNAVSRALRRRRASSSPRSCTRAARSARGSRRRARARPRPLLQG